MLDCEIDDFLHWAETGAIKLWTKIDEYNCGVLSLSAEDYSFLVELIENQPQNSVSNEVEVAIGISKLRIDRIDLLEHESATEVVFIEIIAANGLWAVDFTDINYYLDSSRSRFNAVLVYSDSLNNTRFALDLDSEIYVEIESLIINRNDLEKLHNVIISGSPSVVPNEINTTSPIKKIEKNPLERNSMGRAETMLSIVELALSRSGLSPSLIDNPYKLYSAINDLLLEQKLPQIQISDKAFAGMLDQGKNARFKRGRS